MNPISLGSQSNNNQYVTSVGSPQASREARVKTIAEVLGYARQQTGEPLPGTPSACRRLATGTSREGIGGAFSPPAFGRPRATIAPIPFPDGAGAPPSLASRPRLTLLPQTAEEHKAIARALHPSLFSEMVSPGAARAQPSLPSHPRLVLPPRTVEDHIAFAQAMHPNSFSERRRAALPPIRSALLPSGGAAAPYLAPASRPYAAAIDTGGYPSSMQGRFPLNRQPYMEQPFVLDTRMPSSDEPAEGSAYDPGANRGVYGGLALVERSPRRHAPRPGHVAVPSLRISEERFFERMPLLNRSPSSSAWEDAVSGQGNDCNRAQEARRSTEEERIFRLVEDDPVVGLGDQTRRELEDNEPTTTEESIFSSEQMAEIVHTRHRVLRLLPEIKRIQGHGSNNS